MFLLQGHSLSFFSKFLPRFFIKVIPQVPSASLFPQAPRQVPYTSPLFGFLLAVSYLSALIRFLRQVLCSSSVAKFVHKVLSPSSVTKSLPKVPIWRSLISFLHQVIYQVPLQVPSFAKLLLQVPSSSFVFKLHRPIHSPSSFTKFVLQVSSDSHFSKLLFKYLLQVPSPCSFSTFRL